jgi:hypothetical protein
VPILVPANADALTLRQRVSRLKGKINCLRRIPVIQYNDFAAYGDPVDGPNKANTYDTASPTSTSTDNPDSLTELGATTGLDWGFPITGFPAPPTSCSRFGRTPTTSLIRAAPRSSACRRSPPGGRGRRA